MSQTAPRSPCINVCSLDAAGYCIGCYRSIEEIARWRSLTAAEQRQVIEAAARRRTNTLPQTPGELT